MIEEEESSNPQPAKPPVSPLQMARAFTMPALRRPWTTALIAFPVAMLGLGLSVGLPQSFRAEVIMLVQPNRVLPKISTNFGSNHDDDPTRSAVELIGRRDNLTALVRELDLVSSWQSSRGPIMSRVDWVRTKLRGPDPFPELTVVGILERKLRVSVGENNTFSLRAEWPSPLARDIVEAARRRYFEDRERADLGVIDEAIAILEKEREKRGVVLEAALADVVKTSSKAGKTVEVGAVKAVLGGGGAPRAAAAPRTGGGEPAPAGAGGLDSVRNALRDRLAKTREELRIADEPHRQRVADLQRQLNEAKLSLAPAHPSVLALEQRLADARAASDPEVERLRAEERELVGQLRRVEDAEAAGATGGAAAAGSAAAPIRPTPGLAPASPPTTAPAPIPAAASGGLDAELETARNRLSAAFQSYGEIEDRISTARIERVTLEAGFRHRFVIIQPADRVERSGIPHTVFIPAGLFLGIILGMLGAVIRERIEGRLEDPDQLAQRTGLVLLGEVEL